MSSDGRVEMDRALGLLREGLGPFVAREVAYNEQAARLADFRRENGLEQKHIGDWDVVPLLKFMDYRWRLFGQALGLLERGLLRELRDWRNKWAHQEQLAQGDVERALDSAARLLRAVNAESQADEVVELRDRFIQAGRTPSPRHDPVPPNPQPSAPHRSQADAIREYALTAYVAPWRESDADVLTIRAGDVERRMGLRQATPNVCSALEGRKFLALANLELVHRDGPKRSTTTTYHYRGAN